METYIYKMIALSAIFTLLYFVFLENQERESKRYFLNFVTNLKSEIIMRNHLMVLKPES